jgi:hypothetical protein
MIFEEIRWWWIRLQSDMLVLRWNVVHWRCTLFGHDLSDVHEDWVGCTRCNTASPRG